MRTLGIIFAIVFSVNVIQGQSILLLTQSDRYQTLINPASLHSDFLQSEAEYTFGISYKNQFAKISDPDNAFIASIDYIRHTERKFDLKFGLDLVSDNQVPIRNTRIVGRVASVLSDDPFFGSFAIGFSFGLNNMGIDESKLRLLQLENVSGYANGIKGTYGLGLFWHKQFPNGNGLSTGLSVPFLESMVSTKEYVELPTVIWRMTYQLYFSEATYVEATSWIKGNQNGDVDIDLYATLYWNNLVWLGMGINDNDFLSLNVGLKIKDYINSQYIKIGLGYNVAYSNSVLVQLGSLLELNLSTAW